ncbi:hypothetical protein P608_21980 [Comamonas thiooxydans]|uniref:Uncharacterized protein n=1 Tax=Comamonas thiooxydans TaxID=363952 RepID=A0A0E3BVL9_9BURK|nr:hypothetical protein P608_21980 [Comamonas thiooxydans]KGH20049.1 hypothetical protein P607_10270 [Comamonas thiooxydans]
MRKTIQLKTGIAPSEVLVNANEQLYVLISLLLHAMHAIHFGLVLMLIMNRH